MSAKMGYMVMITNKNKCKWYQSGQNIKEAPSLCNPSHNSILYIHNCSLRLRLKFKIKRQPLYTKLYRHSNRAIVPLSIDLSGSKKICWLIFIFPASINALNQLISNFSPKNPTTLFFYCETARSPFNAFYYKVLS